MIIPIQLFAAARELASTDTLEIELPEGSTVADARQVIAIQCPPIANLALRSAMAVNAEYADDQHAIAAQDELAIIPPVSGG